jgi:hypothetical protein
MPRRRVKVGLVTADSQMTAERALKLKGVILRDAILIPLEHLNSLAPLQF